PGPASPTDQHHPPPPMEAYAMYEFEPVSPTYGISEAVVAHRLRGGVRLHVELPGGYRPTLRTRELGGPVQAALAAPSPTGPTRTCTARISSHTPTPAVSRIINAVTRYAPALPDARDAQPPREATARLLITGTPFQQSGEPGLLVQFGPAQARLDGRRLSVTLSAPGNGLSLILGGHWDAPSTARLTAVVLRELTDTEELANQVASVLPPGPWQVLTDQWHPDAALVLPSSPRWGPEDPLGRRVSRALRELQHGLRADRPDWDFQELISAEGSAVAFRVTPRDRAVPRLVRRVVGDGAFGSGELGNTRTTFLPTDLPAFPCLKPDLMPRAVTSPLDLYVAPEPERDMYGVKLELGGWRYVLDIQAVFYGPGWYPFHKHVTRREKGPTAPLNDRLVPTGQTVPAAVRISPDVENRSWRNEYVQLTPVDHRVEARLQLYAGDEQGCPLVRTVTLQIDLGRGG
ncbi:hypothetical protein AB0F07_40515, partial [Streptomyces fructofermentans]|uniref:hypothetical protein n=1 Tax=Streptomyces fructofermentans TaxID=152141 RepID=UPI0033E0CC87